VIEDYSPSTIRSPEQLQEHPMAEKLDEKELVSFKEMLMANSIQVDAVAQLLIEKGIVTEDEFYSKSSHVVHEYREKQKGKIG
jgi:hypothetical protein